MMLDIKTLMMLYVIVNVISAGAVAVIRGQNRRGFAGISFWLVGLVMQAAGATLIVLRGLVPDLVSMTLANTMIVAGLLIIFIGLERFTGKKGWQIHNYILLAVFIAVSAYFAVVQPNMVSREISSAAMAMIFNFQCAWLLLRRVYPGMRQITGLSGLVFAVYAASNFARIILIIIVPEQGNDFFNSGPVSALTFITYIVLSVCFAISLVLMVNRRLLADVTAEEEKFTTAFNSSPYAITLTRPSDGRIVEVNGGFVNITGYQYAEVIGKTTIELSLWVNEKDRLAVVSELAWGRDVHGVEYQFRKKTGEVITGLFSANLITVNNETCILSSIADISARKRAEEELRTNKLKLDNALLSVQMGMWSLEIAGNKRRFDNQTCRLLGINPSTFGGTAEEFFAVVHPDDREKIRVALIQTIEQDELYDPGYRVVWPDGSIHYICARGRLVHDDKGRPLRISGVIYDVTESKQTQNALQESEARYRLLAEHTADIVALMDMNLSVTYQSPSSEKVRGFTCQELKDLPQEKNLAPESLKLAFEALYRELPSIEADPGYNPVTTLELEFYRKNGTTVWMESKFSIIREVSGKPVSILLEAREITERKQAEEAIREERWRLQSIIEGTQSGTWEWNVQTGETVFNETWAQITGYTLAELSPISIKTWEALVHPEDLKQSDELLERHFSGELTYYDCECRMKHKDGHWVWVHDRGRIVTRTADGKPLMMFGTHSDITDRKRLDEERQRVAKLESVGVLSGGIAHDFNNILTSILGNISLAKMDAAPGSDLQNSLEQAEKASQRATALTKQLLTFSKGGAPVKTLASLAETLKDTAGFALSGSNVKCHFSIPADLWHAEIDAGQISQVIHNLVINAQQAMPTGGRIELTAENISLSNRQSLGRGLPLKEGDYVRIAVADHGTGIPKDHLEKIFDPFFTTKQKGNGLGLASSFSIARQHGGHISVESKVGSGSTFYLYLPASTETTAPEQDSKEAMKTVGKARILVMDDEQGIREVAGNMLKHIGYKDVEFAVDGTEAVKLYKSAMKSANPFSVCILDLTIAGGMGGEVAIQKLLKIDPAVKAIVSSGYIDDSVIAKFSDYGFSGMVAKPYTLEQLRNVLQDVIG